MDLGWGGQWLRAEMLSEPARRTTKGIAREENAWQSVCAARRAEGGMDDDERRAGAALPSTTEESGGVGVGMRAETKAGNARARANR